MMTVWRRKLRLRHPWKEGQWTKNPQASFGNNNYVARSFGQREPTRATRRPATISRRTLQGFVKGGRVEWAVKVA